MPKGAKVRTDKVLKEAVEYTREVVADIIDADDIGEYLGCEALAERLAEHSFECTKAGYVGWRWVISVARAPRHKTPTICEVNLLPGKGALLAPAWVPWEERLKPGDVSDSDVLPYRAEDERLENRSSAEDVAPTLHRSRKLSDTGSKEAKRRWGRRSRSRDKGKKPVATCDTCGFLVSLEGDLKTDFGVCANEWSQADGRVVPLNHGCGAHSETDVTKDGSDWPVTPPRVNEFDLEVLGPRS